MEDDKIKREVLVVDEREREREMASSTIKRNDTSAAHELSLDDAEPIAAASKQASQPRKTHRETDAKKKRGGDERNGKRTETHDELARGDVEATADLAMHATTDLLEDLVLVDAPDADLAPVRRDGRFPRLDDRLFILARRCRRWFGGGSGGGSGSGSGNSGSGDGGGVGVMLPHVPWAVSA
jgi:hypothetical protein